MISANYLRYTLKPGMPLVLRGPQGCGKTTLARAIAKRHGSYIECNVIDFTRTAGWKAACATVVDTIIVEGIPNFAELPGELKSLFAGESPKPKKFIFCGLPGDGGPLDEFPRCYLINMPARQA
jgi:adenylate kinase family enzyme